jgi:hypothetical protein
LRRSTNSSTDRTVRTVRKTIHHPTNPYGPYTNCEMALRMVRENDLQIVNL